MREVLARHGFTSDMSIPRPLPHKGLGGFRALEQAPLFESLAALCQPVRRTAPEPMERFGQSYGFALYRTQVSGPRSGEELSIREAHDRAMVFVGGRYAGALERDRMPASLPVAIPDGNTQLDILVENMGRVNYGPALHDRKGITEGVMLGQQHLFHWIIHPLTLDDLSKLQYKPLGASAGPAFYRIPFAVSTVADTFLSLEGWTKGVCWINGFNIGRSWNRGPQKTLYVPAPLLREGENELIVFELHGSESFAVEFREQPDLG